MNFASIVTRPPPRIMGVTNIPNPAVSDSREAAATPGNVSGNVTEVNVLRSAAPRLRDASSRAGSTDWIGPISVMIAKGSIQWTVPTVTANSFDSSRNGPTPTISSRELSGPVRPRTATHAYALTIVWTKNIVITMKSSVRLVRVDRARAIV